jgi:outer membrane protein TolC
MIGCVQTRLIQWLRIRVHALTAERSVRDLANRRLTASVGLLKALGGGWDSAELANRATGLRSSADEDRLFDV